MSAVVYLIPIAIAEDGYEHLSSQTKSIIHACDVFFVENLRTARRAFRKIDPQFYIDGKQWVEVKQEEQSFIQEFKKAILDKLTIGIVSESGCPGIADPGQVLVSLAQELCIRVKPLAGPSSIIMTLMASGMNGQQFSFNGYLPIPVEERIKKIKELEKKATQENYTQIFIETPYRNQQMIESLLSTLNSTTRLCIGYHISSSQEWVKTKTITDWKKEIPKLEKEPAVFIIGT
ncbi:MAG: hypothetical protein RLZZ595_1535 [Bacteroidota bacterium]|jgi:16S rRNA (cytidine1402-2'-O)-methyltransferase